MNEENFKQLCDKALLLINGVSEEVFLYEDEKAFVGAWATVMSLMMIIPWAVYADSPQVEDSSIVTESSAAEAMAEQEVIKEQKNSTQNTETDWVLFSCIGGGAVVVLIMIGLMAKKK